MLVVSPPAPCCLDNRGLAAKAGSSYFFINMQNQFLTARLAKIEFQLLHMGADLCNAGSQRPYLLP